MGDTPSADLTQLLHRWGHGDPAALDGLVHEVYPELRLMASRYMSRERSGTIQATALVHDLYLRLLKQEKANFQNRRAFFAFAADSQDMLDLNRALEELTALDPRKAELVQLCAFLGCSRGEAAELLGISLSTAKRDFRLARAWLAQRLGRDAPGD